MATVVVHIRGARERPPPDGGASPDEREGDQEMTEQEVAVLVILEQARHEYERRTEPSNDYGWVWVYWDEG